MNQRGQIEYVSPSVKKLLGYEPQTLIGNGWWELTRKNNTERIANQTEALSLFAVEKHNGAVSFERALLTSNGETKWILWNVLVNTDKTLVGVGQDITSRKKAEIELTAKNKELLVKNVEITDSINYAKRIQDAYTQDPLVLRSHFTNSFILYKPRDVVSGDFYWYHKKGNKLFVAAADCTGHGVPGALMSVIAQNIIKEVVIKRNLEDPGEILHAIDKELSIILENEYNKATTSDGMDIAFTVFNFDTNILAFAGAYRPLILLRKNEIIEYKASRYPIGFFDYTIKNFETNTISISEGDEIYLFTDGYIDQFGGEQSKKFNRKRFYDLLLSAQSMNFNERENYLEYALNNWKQQNDQTDDILVIGIKI